MKGEMTVEDKDLLEQHKICPLCMQKSDSKLDFNLQNNPEITMTTCQNCFGSTASRYPMSNFLASLYDKETYVSDMQQNMRPVIRCAKKIVAKTSFKDGQTIRMIDYGGAKGYLSTCVINELKKKYKQIEIQSYVIDFENQLEDKNINFMSIDQFFNNSDKFDLIILSAVIEHLPNYYETLKKVFEVWNSTSSYLYIRTPYEVPLAKRFGGYKIRWPRHLHDMGPEFLENIPKHFNVNATLTHSSPSVIESDFGTKPIKFLIALAFKIPGHIEAKFLKPLLGYKKYIWKLVGGWEVVFRSK